MMYVSAEQMDVIDLIRGTIERMYNENKEVREKDRALDNYAGYLFYDGKCAGFEKIMEYLDKFEIMEEEE